MTKVLFFLSDGVGGSERITITLSKLLDKTIFQVSYCIVQRGNDSNCPILSFIPEGSDVSFIQMKNRIHYLRGLINTLKREKPHIAFSSLSYININLLIISWLFPRIKFIVRNDNYLNNYRVLTRHVMSLTYRLADLVITQNQEMSDELNDELGLHKTYVFLNPLDESFLTSKASINSPLDNKYFNFVSVGRFAYQKGFDILIEAYKKVHHVLPNSRLYILGKNTEECESTFTEVHKLIVDNNLKDCVICPGYCSNPYPYVKNACCYVLSSRWEGLPNAMIESLYLGTPVAAIKCIPIIERIINEGNNGFLAEKENPNSLADAMLKAYKLGRIQTTYRSGTADELNNLFKKVL